MFQKEPDARFNSSSSQDQTELGWRVDITRVPADEAGLSQIVPATQFRSRSDPREETQSRLLNKSTTYTHTLSSIVFAA